jgi:hypothetical protein
VGDECARIGYAGECVPGTNTLRYCNGGSIITSNCSESGDFCMVNDCVPGEAACCPVPNDEF